MSFSVSECAAITYLFTQSLSKLLCCICVDASLSLSLFPQSEQTDGIVT